MRCAFELVQRLRMCTTQKNLNVVNKNILLCENGRYVFKSRSNRALTVLDEMLPCRSVDLWTVFSVLSKKDCLSGTSVACRGRYAR